MKLYNKKETKVFRKQLRKNLTEEERKVWNVVRNRKILNLKFFRQYAVEKYILDFYCPAIRLCIEADGGHHNKNTTDENRTAYLNTLDIKVIRFWNNEINSNIDGVYQKIHSVAEDLIKTHPNPLLS